MGNESSSSQRASKDLTGFSSTERLKLEEFYQRLGLGHRNSKAAPGESETLLEVSKSTVSGSYHSFC